MSAASTHTPRAAMPPLLDEHGVLLGSEGFATTVDGYGELVRWLSSFGKLAVVGVESSGSYAAGLVRYLRSQRVRVLEVNEPHAHARRRLGKSDPIDAELAARVALAGKSNAIPKQTEGIVESIRQLRVARQSAVKARSAAMVQLQDLIVTAPEALREQLSCRKTIRGKASLCRRLRPALSELEPPLAVRALRAALARAAHRCARRGARRARRAARAARWPRRTAHHRAAGRLDRPRRTAARQRRAERRAPARRGLVRGALRRQSDPGVFGQNQPPPAQLRRRPRR